MQYRTNIILEHPATVQFGLQKAAETRRLDEEMHIGLGVGRPIFRGNLTQLLSKDLAKAWQIERKRSKTVGTVDYAGAFHARMRYDRNQPVPLAFVQFVSAPKNLGIAARGVAQ